MRVTLIRAVIWLVTAAAIAMMFWPLIRQFVGRVAEAPVVEF